MLVRHSPSSSERSVHRSSTWHARHAWHAWHGGSVRRKDNAWPYRVDLGPDPATGRRRQRRRVRRRAARLRRRPAAAGGGHRRDAHRRSPSGRCRRLGVGRQAAYSDRLPLATGVVQLAVCGWLDQWFDANGADPRSHPARPSDQCARVLAPLGGPHRDRDRASGCPAAVWEIVDTLRDGGTVPSLNGPAPLTWSLAAESVGCIG